MHPLKEPSDALRALPNLLTLLRVPLAVVIWVAPHDPVWVFVVLGAAAVTDMLDGFVARRIRANRWAKTRAPGSFAAGTGLGAFLDPLVDKLFIVSTIAAVMWAFTPPLELALAVAARELLMAPVMLVHALVPGAHRERTDFTANLLGKLTTVAQFVAIALLVLAHPGFAMAAWVAAGLGVCAVVVYVARAWRSVRNPRETKGEPP
jgi:cardiolipin synthase